MININDICILQDGFTEIEWNPYSRTYYQEKGYEFKKYGEKFIVKTMDLMKNSTHKIGMVCPVCNKEYVAQFRKINRGNKLNTEPHTICSAGCFKLFKHKDDRCSKCGVQNVIFRHIDGEKMCDKCYNQINRHGKLYKNSKDPNDVEFLWDYAEIILRNSHGEEVGRAKIDKEDVDKVRNIKWRLGSHGYVYGTDGKHNSLKLHRVIMNEYDISYDVDHIYYDKLDNRKAYLRILTPSENRSRSRNKESYKVRMSGVKRYAVEDGIGIRTSLYTCMCEHKCSGCHNPRTWDYKNGHDMTVQELFNIVESNEHGDVTFSGGEPFLQWEQMFYLAMKIKEKTKKTIWCYSGYTFEELIKDEKKRLLLEKCDVLIDGKFDKNLKDLKLQFRGSSNQRVIDMQKTLQDGKVVLYKL